MTIAELLVEKLNVLPPEKQQALLAFAESLVQEAQAEKAVHEIGKSAKLPLSELLQDAEIVGMWSDRPEMEDSTEWVRQLRRHSFNAINAGDSASSEVK